MSKAEILQTVEQVIAAGPFAADWDSLKAYRVPAWYEDGKFGIFIHWGVYSVPAFGNEWYPRNMYVQGSPEYEHHLATYGEHADFGYKDFIPQFTADKFDPQHWANLFRRAGAQFIMPVAEHHDGFQLYASELSEWNATRMGPKRDVIGDLAEAVRREFLIFAVSSHRAEHWWFFNGGMSFDSDVQDPLYAGFYGPAQAKTLQPNQEFLDDWLARTCEVVDKYRPQVVWFDWWIEEPAFEPYLKRFAAFYYNRAVSWGRGVAINYKFKAFPDGTALYDIERGQLDDIRRPFWQTDTAVAKNSWGFTHNQTYKTVDDLVDDLVDIVSKNGALLLNIGPRPDGTIPEPEEELLLGIGTWLQVNGEAVYGTRPWKVYGEGPTQVVGGSFNDTKRVPFTGRDIRFTTRGEILYAVALAWPEGGRLTVKSLASDATLFAQVIEKVELLGVTEPLSWTRDADGLHITLPARQPGDHAFAFRITPVPRDGQPRRGLPWVAGSDSKE